MNAAFRGALATHAMTLVTHIALVNGTDAEVGDGRKSVTWVPDGSGGLEPDDDLVYAMQEGENVSGWRGFDAASGGTNYGGAPLSSVTFANDGTFTLEAAQTGISIDAP